MKTRFSAVIVLALLCIGGCDNQTPTKNAADLKDRATEPPADADPSTTNAANTTADPIVIDVRTTAEWDAGHLQQAIHIPHTEIADKIADVTTDKDAAIVLHCKAGGRAGTALETLKKLGYTNLENIGGYEDAKARFEKPPAAK